MAEIWNKRKTKSERTREEKKDTESKRKWRNCFFWVEGVEKKDRTSIKFTRNKSDKAWMNEMKWNKDKCLLIAFLI